MKVDQFLKDLAEKAGIKSNDPVWGDFLAHTELNKIEIPEQLHNGINQSLLSIEDAKNNHPKIKTHYFAEVMNNLDRGLENLYRELELDQETIDKLNQESSSTKRVALLGKELNEVIKEKSAAAGKKPSEAVASLNQTITELNEKLRIEKENRTKEQAAHKNEMTSFKKQIALNGKVTAPKTIYDELAPEVRNVTLNALLEKELQDSNAEFVLQEDGSLKLQKKDGSNFFDENNRQIGVDDFINKSLAKHKVLKQSAPAGEPNGQPAASGQPATIPGNQNGKRVNSNSLFDESIKGLETEATVMT